VQIPILSGAYADANADFRTSYPLNLVPVPKKTGISSGYLRAAEGLTLFSTTGVAGFDRGGFNWRSLCYRVIADKLVLIAATGVATVLGSVANDGGRVTFDYSFERLAIASGGNLYYYDPTTGVTQVTDPDLGTVLDVVWLNGKFITTDGESLVETDIGDPYSVNPLKYGSSEISPDPVVAVLKLRNELLAVNRYTIEYFDDTATTGFSFVRNDGAVIYKGAISTQACAYFVDTFAFVGSGQNEALSIYLAGQGTAIPIGTRETDTILQQYTDAQLRTLVLESRVDKAHRLLYVRLPDQTLVYDAAASLVLGEPVWFRLASGTNGDQAYRGVNLVFCYGRWLVGDTLSGNCGYLNAAVPTQYGAKVAWEFDTQLVYNESRAAIVHELELVQLPGRAAASDSVIWHSFTEDGLTWSDPKPSGMVTPGQTAARATWLQQGMLTQWRGLRFRGVNDAPAGIARLEARLEGLA
jgi:hypothetical protein